jgi:hypothetical protein
MAYSEKVVSLFFLSAGRRILPAMNAVLVLALLLTQAASLVCTAQCVQRQLPEKSAHCHSMSHACPHASTATTTCNSSLCGMDLLGDNQDRSLPQQRPLALSNDSYGSLPGLDPASFPQASASVRSSVGGPPLIIALRV